MRGGPNSILFATVKGAIARFVLPLESADVMTHYIPCSGLTDRIPIELCRIVASYLGHSGNLSFMPLPDTVQPNALAVAPCGKIFVAVREGSASQIWVIDRVDSMHPIPVSVSSALNTASGIAFDVDERCIYVTNSQAHTVLQLQLDDWVFEPPSVQACLAVNQNEFEF